MQLTSPTELRQKCFYRPKHAVCHSSLSVVPSQCCALQGRLTGRSRTGCWMTGRQRVETERFFFFFYFGEKWQIWDQAIKGRKIRNITHRTDGVEERKRAQNILQNVSRFMKYPCLLKSVPCLSVFQCGCDKVWKCSSSLTGYIT